MFGHKSGNWAITILNFYDGCSMKSVLHACIANKYRISLTIYVYIEQKLHFIVFSLFFFYFFFVVFAPDNNPIRSLEISNVQWIYWCRLSAYFCEDYFHSQIY